MHIIVNLNVYIIFSSFLFCRLNTHCEAGWKVKARYYDSSSFAVPSISNVCDIFVYVIYFSFGSYSLYISIYTNVMHRIWSYPKANRRIVAVITTKPPNTMWMCAHLVSMWRCCVHVHVHIQQKFNREIKCIETKKNALEKKSNKIRFFFYYLQSALNIHTKSKTRTIRSHYLFMNYHGEWERK